MPYSASLYAEKSFTGSSPQAVNARKALKAMIITWRDRLGIDREYRAQQLIDYSLLDQEFRDALSFVARESGTAEVILSVMRLGHWLAKVDGRDCEGLCIRSRVLTGHKLWKLVRASGNEYGELDQKKGEYHV